MFKITLITLGTKMPAWVQAGCNEYAKRFRDGISLQLIEIPLQNRSNPGDVTRIMEKEASLIKGFLPNNARYIALTIEGKSYSSEKLAEKLIQVQQTDSHLCFIIGGPEGLSPEILQLCHEQWSLSPLTLPHPLVRIVFLEALYRAWSITQNHPYHK